MPFKKQPAPFFHGTPLSHCHKAFAGAEQSGYGLFFPQNRAAIAQLLL